MTGADILNLTKIENLGDPVALIEAAGTFDGIFLNGILAGLLSALAAAVRGIFFDTPDGSSQLDCKGVWATAC